MEVIAMVDSEQKLSRSGPGDWLEFLYPEQKPHLEAAF
jgi:hypothetical protein